MIVEVLVEEFRRTEGNNQVRKRVTTYTLPDGVGSNSVDSDTENEKKIPLNL
jgi:hypothetical protein